MDVKKVKRYGVLSILFFLPVTFLLLLYPATHNYTALDIVNEHVLEIEDSTLNTEASVLLKDHISVLGFFGKQPMEKNITASNLKELVYDKFKGFKKFQILIVVPKDTEEAVEKLKREISAYEDIRFWSFVHKDSVDIQKIYKSLKSTEPLDKNLATDHVFIIDKDLNQRGRIDDRSDNELAKNKPVYGLYSYDCIEVAEIKNKMSEDVRILFTEYRQKRKGEFNSETRRADDLKLD
ncbi:hypothetical protein APS56_13035 [Pseudalgibacter alginicilyticus]|uniref:Membrane or secreted protein n=1 Tax=Pseudalgibacter alginicilyticus TaxID=1736674 RepID=A0A0P0CNG2_9FLAO|nr:hypothetical protein [Pseudalgibacter alginicilyticus]ALJ06000.1 hypothetical protein APS56_13035 [Pseudalgibacter alginicilyticus]